MIKDIVVNLAVDGKPDTARNYAVSVAAALDAHLTGVAVVYEPVTPGTIFDSYSASIVTMQRRVSEEAAKTAADAFDEAARKNGISAQSRMILSSFAAARGKFARIALRHDLAIVGQGEPESPSPNDMILEAALFDTGRPVLVVPYIQSAPFRLDRVLLCWDGSRSAARAIADALPLLEHATDIDVVTIASRDDNREEIPGADIAHHLARHSLKVDLQRLVSPETDVANAILSYAADRSSDLIVMGGYGHSRLREFILGGATRGVLASMTVPTFMSH
jgi:nucleotide-binding universal stress UspA family protein